MVLIFSLQLSTKADDIKDFEIEGMTVGESLLNYFDESLIKHLRVYHLINCFALSF